MRNLFIDLGHFKAVPGAPGEWQWVRRIADHLVKFVDTSYWNLVWVPDEFQGVSDKDANLNMRCTWIRSASKAGDQLISIHGNSFTDANARGVETYYASKKPNTEANRLEAIKLTKSFNKYTGIPIRQTGAFPDDHSQHPRLAILQFTIPNALLVEAGFCSNKLDMAVDPELAAKGIIMYANQLNPNYQPMPEPVPNPDEELNKYVKRFKERGYIKSEFGLDNPAKKSEVILMMGRQEDYNEKLRQEANKAIL
jgi:hypothetical protein